jgi:hypothetical protein
MDDEIREAIIIQAEKLGLTAYAIAKKCTGDKTPDVGTVKRYLNGRVSLNSRYASQIFKVLGLEVKPKED